MTTGLYKINWNQFRVKNPDYRNSFETLCHYLFCRRFKVKNGIQADFNHVGLETEPIISKGKYYGYQAKFFDDKIDYSQIQRSVEKAIARYPKKLDFIHIYVNANFKPSSEAAKGIVDNAKKLKVGIEWITPTHFVTLLNKPENLDITQMYFGIGDEIGFIQSCCDPDILTLLAANEYIDLPFVNHNLGIFVAGR